jgi:uncharacterized membrane protein YoaK (UPF0700 family)
LSDEPTGTTGLSPSRLWEAVIGLPTEKHGPLPPLLLLLTVVTGLVDAFSYLVLGHVFVANMTGNVVFLAFAIAGAKGFSIPASFLALAAFGCGAVIGGRMIARLAGHRGHLLTSAVVVQSGLVGAAMVVSLVWGNAGTGDGRYVLIGLLALAMGLQNATSRRLAVPDLTTTVLTLTITGIAADSRVGAGSGSKVGRRGLSIACMFVGALAGALFVLHGNRSIALVLAFVSLVTVVVVVAIRSRETPAPPWTAPVS